MEHYLDPSAGGSRLLVDGDRRRDVLESRAAAVEDGDFVAPRATRSAPSDDIGELRVHLLAGHESAGERVLQLTDLGALIDDIHDDRGPGDEHRVDLLFPLTIGAHGGDERPGCDVTGHHVRAPSRRARNADVTLTERGAEVLGDLGT